MVLLGIRIRVRFFEIIALIDPRVGGLNDDNDAINVYETIGFYLTKLHF